MVATGRRFHALREEPILLRAKRGETQVRVRVGRATHEGAHVHDDTDEQGLCPFPLHHANASRYKAWEELGALEDHLAGDWCPDCVSKHTGMAIKFLREARSLDGGSNQDLDDARTVTVLRPNVRTSIEAVRALRKSIGERVGVRFLVEPPSGHVDEDCGCGEDHDQAKGKSS
jgi:hypothetical protein